MKLILLIAFIQAVFITNNCHELENIHENDNSIDEITKSSMQVNEAVEASNLIDTKKKRENFFKKRLNNDELKKKKKFKPIVYDGYSLDINIEHFKSTVKSY